MDARADIRNLIAAARRGAPDAVGRLFKATRGHLLQLAERELPVEIRAKVGPSDVVQETGIEMHRDFAQFNGVTVEELFSWLRGILRNNVADAVRHYRAALKRDVTREVSLSAGQARRYSQAVAAAIRAPDGSAIRREEAAAIREVLAKLSPPEREVLRLRYWKGLSFVDIAPIVGRSPEAVRKLWFRAIARLRRNLDAADTGGEDASTSAEPKG